MGQYAGDISAAAAWDLLSRETNSILVDVRTPEEWETVGVPDLSGIKKQPLYISWSYKDYSPNESFLSELQSTATDRTQKLFFLCKGGGRSQAAAQAATEAGYKFAFNVANGFEAAQGWQSSGLPHKKNEAKEA